MDLLESLMLFDDISNIGLPDINLPDPIYNAEALDGPSVNFVGDYDRLIPSLERHGSPSASPHSADSHHDSPPSENGSNDVDNHSEGGSGTSTNDDKEVKSSKTVGGKRRRVDGEELEKLTPYQRQRIMRNRASAQLSRDRKKKYTTELEIKNTELLVQIKTIEAESKEKIQALEEQNRILSIRLVAQQTELGQVRLQLHAALMFASLPSPSTNQLTVNRALLSTPVFNNALVAHLMDMLDKMAVTSLNDTASHLNAESRLMLLDDPPSYDEAVENKDEGNTSDDDKDVKESDHSETVTASEGVMLPVKHDVASCKPNIVDLISNVKEPLPLVGFGMKVAAISAYLTTQTTCTLSNIVTAVAVAGALQVTAMRFKKSVRERREREKLGLEFRRECPSQKLVGWWVNGSAWNPCSQEARSASAAS